MKKFLLAALAALTLGSGAAILASAPSQAVEQDDDSKPIIKRFAASPENFYPTVRDGFRDGVTFTGRAATINVVQPGGYDEYGDWDPEGTHLEPAPQSWNITIRNSNGYKVADKTGHHADEYGYLRYAWNGKNVRTGKKVPVGAYRATLIVTNDQTGEKTSTSTRVYAKTDTINRRVTKTRAGYDTSSRWRHGDCQVKRDGWFAGPNSLYLDCRGGSTGVRYGFTLPANARNVTWSAPTEHGFGWDGHLRKSGRRTSAHHFDVKVSVDGWEAYSIKRANVTYTTTVRR